MRVFVSYFGHGIEYMMPLGNMARDRQINIVSQNLSYLFSGKETAVQDMAKFIKEFDCAVVVWSEDYSNDPWLMQELSAMISVEIQREKKFIYPLLYDKAPLHPALRDPINIDGRINDGIVE